MDILSYMKGPLILALIALIMIFVYTPIAPWFAGLGTVWGLVKAVYWFRRNR